MALILGIIFGVLIGAGIAYMWLNQTITRRDQEIRQHKRTIEDLERTRESRLKETVQSLQNDYQQKLDQKTAELTQQYEQRIKVLMQKSSQDSESQVKHAAPATPAPSDQPIQQPTTRIAKEPLQPSSVPQPSSPDPIEQPSQIKIPPVQPATSVEKRQVLIESISKMGNSQNLNHLLELQRLSITSAREVREAIAHAMGNIAMANTGHPSVVLAIPSLGKLSQDPDALVRRAAVTALGHIRSPKVIPFIRRSLRDTDLRVVKAASDAISRFKYFQGSSSAPKTSSKKKRSNGFKGLTNPGK